MREEDLIDVIHIKDSLKDPNRTYLYIGRGKVSVKYVNMDLGNPFSVAEYGRGVCIQMYREYAREQWLYQAEYRKKITDIVDRIERGELVSLVCYCKPRDCHGDVIREAVLKLLKQRYEVKK